MEVADDRHTVEAAIQQEQSRPDAQACGLTQEALEHFLERFALLHPGQGHGITLPFADQVSGGVGVEVTGAALGLATVDLVEVAKRLAVVGDQGQVDGQSLGVLAAATLGRCPAKAALSCRCKVW